MIQVFSNTLGEEELAAVQRCFESRWVGKGKETEAFEQEFYDYLDIASLGYPKPLMTSCATSACLIALQALGIGPGDEVIMPTCHFVGCANAVLQVGAVPVFADVDPRYLYVLPSEIERLRRGFRTKAVLMLHYGGHIAPMNKILAAANGLLSVIEDAANAVASRADVPAGTMGDAGFWSFDAMKMLVTIDGGMLWLRDKRAYRRAMAIRYLGLPPKTTSGIDSQQQGNTRWWEFDAVTEAGRHISNDVHAAIGRIQLKRLPGFIDRRREIWEMYQRELVGVGDLACPPNPPHNTTSSYYLYWIQTGQRDELATYLAENGIYTTFRYYPLHLIKYYGCTERLPNAEQVAETTLCLPIHQNLSDGDVARVIDTVKEFYK